MPIDEIHLFTESLRYPSEKTSADLQERALSTSERGDLMPKHLRQQIGDLGTALMSISPNEVDLFGPRSSNRLTKFLSVVGAILLPKSFGGASAAYFILFSFLAFMTSANIQ